MQDNELMLFDRINVIKDIVAKYGEDNFVLSFSGGKDSTMLHYLVDMALPNNKIPRVFIDTGFEYQMIRQFVLDLQKKDDRIVIVKPHFPLKKMLEEKGYPFKSKDFSHKLDIYQRLGMTKTVKKALTLKGPMEVPVKLKYMFTDKCKLRVSDRCCTLRKEKPFKQWGEEHHRNIHIIGILGDEGGRRSSFKGNENNCFMDYRREKKFYPLRKVNAEFEEWFIKTYNIKLCGLYYPPYNFTRTGCKGCPFALNLQEVLDTLEKHFPNERQQCEVIWKPVYDEYRSIGYRLKKYVQCSLFDEEK